MVALEYCSKCTFKLTPCALLLKARNLSEIFAKMCLCYFLTQLECLRELLDRLESSGVEQVGKACLEKCVVTVLLALAVVSVGLYSDCGR